MLLGFCVGDARTATNVKSLLQVTLSSPVKEKLTKTLKRRVWWDWMELGAAAQVRAVWL
jgi:hypothetical protein